MCVGQSVCVTALRVCVLRGWRGKQILCVTEHSEILNTHTPEHGIHADPQSDTPPPLMMSHAAADDDDGSKETESERRVVQSAVRIKQSRVITYQVRDRKALI